MKSLELKVPPAIVLLVAVGCMCALTFAFPRLTVNIPGKLPVAITFMMLGAAVAALGVREFRKAHTTVNPLAPGRASSLVTSGVFRLTRNPMYLGMALALYGVAWYLQNFLTFVVLAGFVVYITRHQIIPEERAIASKFGDVYADYQSRVRRWV